MNSSFLQKIRAVDQQAADVKLYNPTYTHSLPGNVPFLLSNTSFTVTDTGRKALLQLGPALAELFQVAAKQRRLPLSLVFFRPDVLMTNQGLKVCEIETSPFGLAVSLFLQQAYKETHPLGSNEDFTAHFREIWLKMFQTEAGIFVYSEHTAAFTGQLQYLATLLKKVGLKFSVKSVNQVTKADLKKPFYRAFYWYEQDLDPAVAAFIKQKPRLFPDFGSYFEGKYLLADYFQDDQLKNKLSFQTNLMLSRLLMQTWYITPDVPANFPIPLKNWEELSLLPQQKRMFVVKMAGGHVQSSWGKSVNFLHKISGVEVRQLFKQIADDKKNRWIIQPFYGNIKAEMNYGNESLTELLQIKGRVRLTPYYLFPSGKIFSAKATIRKDTLLIHAASDSINATVS